MDYLRVKNGIKKYVLPPKNIEVVGFEDTLLTIIPDKIKELISRLEEITKIYQQRLASLKPIPGEFNFFVEFYEYDYQSENLYIEAWLEYWNNLLKPKINYKPSKITDEGIQKARNFPLEKLYKGDLVRSGSRYKGLCPFHEEKTPSFFIFDNNKYHCYGCQEHGNPIDFLMKVENISFKDAVKELLR